MNNRYPNLTTASVRVILTAAPGAEITPHLVTAATRGQGDFAEVIADLDRVHMIDETRTLTPLAIRYAAMCRREHGRRKPP